MVRDTSEPVIFSPGLVLYPGGSLALSGIINLLSGLIQKSRRGSGDVTDRS
jgi:hypothetical protein